MTDPKLPRPRQVTTSAVMIMVGSVAVVLTVFGQVTAFDTLESRRALEEALSVPPADALGLGVEAAQTGLRVLATIAAACAAAAAILGYQVLSGSRSARTALGVLALPLFVTGIASGGILSSVVVAASVMLWVQPARDWFNGVAAPAAPAGSANPSARGVQRGRGAEGAADERDPVVREAQRSAFRTPPPVAPPSVDPPPVDSDRTGPPAYPSTYGAPGGAPVVQPGARGSRGAGAEPARAAGGPRPAAVTWACVVTWVFTGLAAGMMALVALALVVVPDLYDEVTRQAPELARQGITESQVVATAVTTAVVVVLWSALAAFLAVQTWRRRSWARIALIASASAAGLFSVTGVLASAVLVVPLAACVAVVVLLLRTEVRWWVR